MLLGGGERAAVVSFSTVHQCNSPKTINNFPITVDIVMKEEEINDIATLMILLWHVVATASRMKTLSDMYRQVNVIQSLMSQVI